MASSVADAFYAISSVIVILASSALLLRRRSTEEDQRFVLSVALLSFVSIVAFLVVLSISFDFGRCPYPSREHPNFTSGRLLKAAAVPFFLLFVYTIDRFGKWTKQDCLRWTLLAATVLFLTVRNCGSTRRPFLAGTISFTERRFSRAASLICVSVFESVNFCAWS